VRIIKQTVKDPGRPQAEAITYRLAATILAPQLASAPVLTALGAERREFESALDELQTRRRGPRVVLRPTIVDAVNQEGWGMFCVHYAIRALLCQAAHESGVDTTGLVHQD